MFQWTIIVFLSNLMAQLRNTTVIVTKVFCVFFAYVPWWSLLHSKHSTAFECSTSTRWETLLCLYVCHFKAVFFCLSEIATTEYLSLTLTRIFYSEYNSIHLLEIVWVFSVMSQQVFEKSPTKLKHYGCVWCQKWFNRNILFANKSIWCLYTNSRSKHLLLLLCWCYRCHWHLSSYIHPRWD